MTTSLEDKNFDRTNRRLDRYIDINENAHKELADNIQIIKDNHLTHLKDDVACIDKKVTELGTDIKWIKKNQWFFMSTAIGFIISVFVLIIRFLIMK
jgi:hypothetical protein